MKYTYEHWKNLLNSKLEQYKQNLRVDLYKKSCLILNTGDILANDDFTKFKRRVMSTKTDLWVKNIDKLIAGKITEQQIKSELSSVGGKAVQRLHGEKIKSNLNTGVPWNKGSKGLTTCWAKGLTKETDSRVAKLAKFGERNGMFGKKMSDEEKLKKSIETKNRILSGEFTPNSNNRNTHWESFYSDKSYRSSWEAWYQYLNNDAEYETLRIEYFHNNIRKIYVVDFIDHKNKLVIEVKPEELTRNEIFSAKWNALIEWAKQNQYEAKLVTLSWLIENTIAMDYSNFDEQTARKIRKIYETRKKN